MTAIHTHTYAHGLRLIAEPMPGAKSLAMTWLLPAGVAQEPAERQGVATLLAEMVCRGAGELDARAHSDALDQLGVQRGTSVETRQFRLGATMIGEKVGDALPLLVDMIRRPMLAESALEPSRDLALQTLDSLEDEPQQRVSLALRRQHYPAPLGRSPFGERAHLEATTLDDVRQYWQRTFVPEGGILAFAGDFQWDALRELVGKLTADWRGGVDEAVVVDEPARGYTHENASSAQVHIGLAYDAVPETDPRRMLQRAAVAVLSGGMSGRLFTEVREKRGLCYAVMARYTGWRDRGAVLGYAGTTSPRAQETLDVMVGEFKRLTQGIDESEFQRAIVGMKSNLVMQGESSSARAMQIAADQYVLGRPRTLDEVAAEVDAVTFEALNAFVRDQPPGDMTIVTIGPTPLRTEGV